MLAKYIVARSLGIRNVGAISRMYHGGGYYKASTMNDLPVPQGDWQEHNSRKNTKYNATLATGLGIFILSIAVAKSTNAIHLNFSPPKSID